jgi:aryl-alcohol dehydrogenase-like predicted oxidoreductase
MLQDKNIKARNYKMEKSLLGKSRIEVSKLCFGTLTIGPIQAGLSLDYGSELISYAIKKGIIFFDTAQLYETYLYIKEGMKKASNYDIVISSKTYAYTRQMAIDAVEQARKSLDRDYIDIFMLHEQESIYTLDGHEQALEYLYECKQKGIVRAVGASMHHIQAVVGATIKELDIIHPMLNVEGLGIADGNRTQMENAIKNAYNQGIGVFSMKAFAGGNLFKKAEKCLDYVLSKQYINSVAIGMQSFDEIDANIHFFNNGFFDENQKDELNKKHRKLHIDDWCVGCGKCVLSCKNNALSIINKKAVVDIKKCVLCGYCCKSCKEWCIKIV